MPPLIAHVIHRLDVGGLENGLVNLINRMPPERYRHAIICMTGYSEFRRRLTREVEIIDLGKRPGKDLGVHFRLWRELRRLKPAIVHTRNFATLEAVLPATLAGVKARVHGEHGWDVGDMQGASRKHQHLRRLFAPLVSRFITLSRHSEQYLREQVGVPAHKIAQIYNGVETALFYPRCASDGSLLPPGFAPADAVVIGTVGRMQQVKDQPTLARAFVRLLDLAPGLRERARLVLVGEGPLLTECEMILRQGGVEALAWLPGSRDDVPALMRCLDIFVLPSLAEGISNTILEAMASGLPVVATRVGGNPELVGEAATGLLVAAATPEEMAQALLEYCTNADLRSVHGTAGRAKVEARFSMAAMVSNYLAVYDGVFGAG